MKKYYQIAAIGQHLEQQGLDQSAKAAILAIAENLIKEFYQGYKNQDQGLLEYCNDLESQVKQNGLQNYVVAAMREVAEFQSFKEDKEFAKFTKQSSIIFAAYENLELSDIEFGRTGTENKKGKKLRLDVLPREEREFEKYQEAETKGSLRPDPKKATHPELDPESEDLAESREFAIWKKHVLSFLKKPTQDRILNIYNQYIEAKYKNADSAEVVSELESKLRAEIEKCEDRLSEKFKLNLMGLYCQSYVGKADYKNYLSEHSRDIEFRDQVQKLNELYDIVSLGLELANPDEKTQFIELYQTLFPEGREPENKDVKTWFINLIEEKESVQKTEKPDASFAPIGADPQVNNPNLSQGNTQ